MVEVLRQCFGHGLWRAKVIMLRAHVIGRSEVGTYPRDEAEERVANAHRRARAAAWPLTFSVQPAG
ncbi:MAG: ATP-dependent Clp protease adaptor ClpS [Vicinamibacteria bacterium]|nr:ATP-dependent Clp protease adaptor ClpS [Vicinamibacteria bacterium]